MRDWLLISVPVATALYFIIYLDQFFAAGTGSQDCCTDQKKAPGAHRDFLDRGGCRGGIIARPADSI